MSVEGPFMNLKQAAAYCGYAPDTFRRKIQDYCLPRHGPEKNRFAKSVLDAWMESPNTFAKQRYTRRKPRLVTV